MLIKSAQAITPNKPLIVQDIIKPNEIVRPAVALLKTGQHKKLSISTKLLVFLGLRSECCGADVYVWDARHAFCRNCGNRVD